MMHPGTRPLAAAACLALLSGCGATKLATQASLPPPLLEEQPARVGVYYSKEFRDFVHKETRAQVDYEITLGPAHVTNLNWLLDAMFREVVEVPDPASANVIRPPLVMVLEPRFEEYSFLTPKDVAGEAFIVTIRYLLTVYDGGGARVDSYAYTGYGRERARTLASKEPLQIATQRAMRDAGAKVAVELTDQEAVRMLLRNPAPVPMPAQPAVSASDEAPATESPAGETAVEQPPVEESPVEESPVEESPAEAAPPPGPG